MGAVSVQEASARTKDKPNFGYCKSGQKIGDVAKCKKMADFPGMRV